MARIRTIKPSFWQDVAPLSHEARLLAIGLISLADDAGRFIDSHTVIAGYIYPHEDIPPAKLRRWLGEIVNHGMVELYQNGTFKYGWLPKFNTHQRIDKPQPSTLPPPPQSENHSTNGSENHSLNQSQIHSWGEGKGREEEWKGEQARDPLP